MAISLEQWEQKTQLTETELQSVYDLQDACEELPLPTNWVKIIIIIQFFIRTCRKHTHNSSFSLIVSLYLFVKP